MTEAQETQPEPQPAPEVPETLGRRVFMAMLGTALLPAAAAVITNGAPFTNLGIHEKFGGDPFRRDYKPARREGGYDVYRTEVYLDEKDKMWTVTFHAIKDAHGRLLEPDISYTCEDKGLLEAAVQHTHEEAAMLIARDPKANKPELVRVQKVLLDKLSGKDRHLTLDDAKKAGVELSDYVKPYNKAD